MVASSRLAVNSLVQAGEPVGAVGAEAVEEETESDGCDADEDVVQNALALGILSVDSGEGCGEDCVVNVFHTHMVSLAISRVNPQTADVKYATFAVWGLTFYSKVAVVHPLSIHKSSGLTKR
jgi:hypothetical protein